MKKLISFALVLTIVLAFVVPAMAANSGFIGGTVASINKSGYDSFDGKQITSNNSVTQFDNFRFVADNKILNAWYIDVTDDISGALKVAYKVGSAYYVVTFDIDGAGKYWIADSRGSTGANMVKIGAFKEKSAVEFGYVNFWINWVFDPDINPNMTYELFREIYDSGAFDFNVHFTNGYGDVPSGYNYTDYYPGGMKSVTVPLGEAVDFKIDPISGSFRYQGYLYTWSFFFLDSGSAGLTYDTNDGMHFIAGDDNIPSLTPDFFDIELIFWFMMDREKII